MDDEQKRQRFGAAFLLITFKILFFTINKGICH